MKTTKSKASVSILEETRKSTRAGLSMVRGTVYLYRRMPPRTNKSRGFMNLATKSCGSTNKLSNRSTIISTIMKSIFRTLKVLNTFSKNMDSADHKVSMRHWARSNRRLEHNPNSDHIFKLK